VNLEAPVPGQPARWPLGKLAAGTWWLHARASDLAGNWGPATHFRLEVPGPLPAKAVEGR
jgi:hypothetical protein